jgi:hypothetical protein
MTLGTVLAPDAAIVLGIASTAMPFARTHEDEVERWLRLLRAHGQAGTALQALGFSESVLPQLEESRASEQAASGEAGGEQDAVKRVSEHAIRAANDRGARAITTADVFLAVMHVYGDEFDRALRAHGTDRDEVLGRLGLTTPVSIDHRS